MAQPVLKGISWIVILSQVIHVSQSLCPSSDYPPTHTACLNTSIYATSPSGVLSADQATIVSYHNTLRRQQNATDMQLVVWDAEVAYVAQKLAGNCVYQHDTQRYIPGKYSAGQNIALGYTSWQAAIQAWYDEIRNFVYGAPNYTFSNIGHYTQIVWNSSAKIGCGFATCTNLVGNRFYVCNYAPAGNLVSRIQYPFTRGTKCASCPGKCNNGLCDCGGLVCKNSGTLNLQSCTCSCPPQFPVQPDCSAISASTTTRTVPPTTSIPTTVTTRATTNTVRPPSLNSTTATTKGTSSTIPPTKPSSTAVNVGATTNTISPTRAPTTVTAKASTNTVPPTTPPPMTVTMRTASITVPQTTRAPATVTTRINVNTVPPTTPAPVTVTTTVTTSTFPPTTLALTSVNPRATTNTVPTTTATPTTATTKATTNTVPPTTSAPTTVTTKATTSTIYTTQTTAAISSGCPSPSYPPTHTACLSTSSFASNPRGITATEKQQIIAYHNSLRARQTATDMQLTVWDDEVAFVAQKWSDNCDYRHDSERYIPGKYSAGQNIAYGFVSWNATIQAWYDEIKLFTYGSQNFVFSNIGHYTQVVWNSTAKIGCGATRCTNLGAVFYVCNYAPAGNLYTSIPTPYTNGSKCSACTGRCKDGLCDCGGLVCKNGGTLNLTTCTCSCQRPYSAMPDCNLNCTGVNDQWYCGTQWPPSYCKTYSNVPFDCPIMCGVCPGNPTVSVTSIAPSTASPATSTVAAAIISTTPKTGTSAAGSQTTASITGAISTTRASFTGCPSPSYPPTHTACLNMSANAVNPRGVSAAEKLMIVAYHNNLRGMQNATDMQLTVWDDEVAYVAQKWSDNCVYEHDSERNIPDKYSAGQNIAYGFTSWNSTIQAWYDEIKDFTYGSTNNVFHDIGHYTQVVWNSTARIGCGATTCSNLRAVFYVCNYAPAGNLNTQIPTPYTRGNKCAACPGRCVNGLCNCSGLVCKNGGTVNLSTCTCSCPSPYTGMPDCNLNCAGVVDQWYCNQYPTSYCTTFYNVPLECPKRCGICPAA